MARFVSLLYKHATNVSQSTEAQGELGAQEVRNEKALFVFNRVQHKLTGMARTKLFVKYFSKILESGRDFNPEVSLTVQVQVEKLIDQATALENLCQCFSGWCAFW
jgi:FKBP12-rapamycin complex-associated protein